MIKTWWKICQVYHEATGTNVFVKGSLDDVEDLVNVDKLNNDEEKYSNNGK
jgi:hypothetical protein